MANQAYAGMAGQNLTSQASPMANDHGSVQLNASHLLQNAVLSPGPLRQLQFAGMNVQGLMALYNMPSTGLENPYLSLGFPGLTTTQSHLFPTSPVVAPSQTILTPNDLRYPQLNSKQRMIDIGNTLANQTSFRKIKKEEEKIQTTAMSTRRLDRASAWTHREEVFLWGIMVQKFLSEGTLFHPLKPTRVVEEEKRQKAAKKKQDKGLPLSSEEKHLLLKMENQKKGDGNFNKCFREVKALYDQVWDRFLAQNPGENRNYKRSWQALKRHYKAMKTEYSKNGDGKFERLYSKWRNDYNLNGKLLDQSSLSSTSTDTIPVEYHERANAWDKIEESFLVGAIMTRFLLHGSLTTPRPKSTKGVPVTGTVPSNDDPKDCWFAVKKAYDHYWATYRPKEERKPRTVDALSRHYKIMKRRIVDRPGTKTFAPFYEEFLEIQKNA